MTEKKCIYLIFSSTPLKMGAFIRYVTGERYNHLSLSLGCDLSTLYSFARKYRNTPFYGGFVRESAERFKNSGRFANIRICAVPVTAEQYKAVARILFKMNSDPKKYRYNTISAIFALRKKRIYIENSYTCIEFVVEILNQCNITDKIKKERFYSLSDLQNIFGDCIIYDGVFPNIEGNSTACNDTYSIRKNIALRYYLTASANAGLIYLLLKSKRNKKKDGCTIFYN